MWGIRTVSEPDGDFILSEGHDEWDGGHGALLQDGPRGPGKEDPRQVALHHRSEGQPQAVLNVLISVHLSGDDTRWFSYFMVSSLNETPINWQTYKPKFVIIHLKVNEELMISRQTHTQAISSNLFFRDGSMHSLVSLSVAGHNVTIHFSWDSDYTLLCLDIHYIYTEHQQTYVTRIISCNATHGYRQTH